MVQVRPWQSAWGARNSFVSIFRFLLVKGRKRCFLLRAVPAHSYSGWCGSFNRVASSGALTAGRLPGILSPGILEAGFVHPGQRFHLLCPAFNKRNAFSFNLIKSKILCFDLTYNHYEKGSVYIKHVSVALSSFLFISLFHCTLDERPLGFVCMCV